MYIPQVFLPLHPTLHSFSKFLLSLSPESLNFLRNSLLVLSESAPSRPFLKGLGNI